jgi:hypothetical protein
MGLQFGLRLELTLALFENKAAGELMRGEVIGGERKGRGLWVRRTGVDQQGRQWDRENRRPCEGHDKVKVKRCTGREQRAIELTPLPEDGGSWLLRNVCKPHTRKKCHNLNKSSFQTHSFCIIPLM